MEKIINITDTMYHALVVDYLSLQFAESLFDDLALARGKNRREILDLIKEQVTTCKDISKAALDKYEQDNDNA